MPHSATAQQLSAIQAPNQAKRQRISKRMQQAIGLLASKGITQREAAKQAGLTEWHLSKELKKPQIRAFLSEKARQNLAQGVLRSSVRVLELVDGASEHVALDAAKFTLALEGIKPADNGVNVSITNNISPGYVIDLAADPRTIEHDKE